MKKHIFLLTLTLLALAVLSSCASASSPDSPASGTVSVSGTGTVYMKPDIVSFTVQVSESAETTAAAQQAANKKVSAVLSILRAYSIAEEDMTTTSLSFYTDYYWENGRQIKESENVSQSVYVKMRDLDKFPALVDALGSAVSGITFSSVSFDAEDKSEAVQKARALAFEDARDKAAEYASHARMKLGKPSVISENSTYAGRAVNLDYKAVSFATAEAAYATEAPTGLLSVSVYTNIEFNLY